MPPSAPLRDGGAPVNGMGIVLDADGIRRAVRRIAHEIVEMNQGVGGLALVGIQRGGAILARRIADQIEAIEGARPPVGALDVTLYRDDLVRRGIQPQPQPSDLPNIEGKTVVLVDDVLMTGRTVRAALDGMNDFGRPRAVRLAVLVDRGHRELPIRADLVGKNIPTSAQDDVRVMLEELDGSDGVVVVSRRVTA